MFVASVISFFVDSIQPLHYQQNGYTVQESIDLSLYYVFWYKSSYWMIYRNFSIWHTIYNLFFWLLFKLWIIFVLSFKALFHKMLQQFLHSWDSIIYVYCTVYIIFLITMTSLDQFRKQLFAKSSLNSLPWSTHILLFCLV